MKTDLRLDWCSHAAARYAVDHWHYSKRMPVFKRVSIGVWERGRFVGAVLFGQGATPELGKKFALNRTQICELTRVALTRHESPTSRIIAVALRMLASHCKNLRLVISFADTDQGHIGGIYQAGNWVYAGESVTHGYVVNGKLEHPKTLHSRYGVGGQSIPWLTKNVDPVAKRVVAGVKHRYLYALDAAMRAQIEPLRKPYPKRVASADSGTMGHQSIGGGANPTATL